MLCASCAMPHHQLGPLSLATDHTLTSRAACRKHAVLILTEDPNQRLQLQHLAALLHLRLGGPVPPDALLAGLSGPGSAGIFACQQVAMQFQGYSRVPVVRLQVERLVQLLQQAASSGSDSSSALDQGQRPAARQPRSSSGQVPEVTLQHCIQWVYDTWPPNTVRHATSCVH